MTYKKIILSFITALILCSMILLCSCTKKDGDVGDNPDHSSSHSPSASVTSPNHNTQSPLESMIPDVMD